MKLTNELKEIKREDMHNCSLWGSDYWECEHCKVIDTLSPEGIKERKHFVDGRKDPVYRNLCELCDDAFHGVDGEDWEERENLHADDDYETYNEELIESVNQKEVDNENN